MVFLFYVDDAKMHSTASTKQLKVDEREVLDAESGDQDGRTVRR